PVSPRHLGELLALIEEGVISGKIAKTVFEDMAATGRPPKEIVEEKGLVQMTDESAIAEIVERIVAANPGQAEEYRGGKTKLMGFFVGQVMKETKGKANPKMVNEILKKTLEG
ncbi:MAG: Asp-tRNA(Asn)/Glu-tRNA(Gln) amidotransferase GatCAB subunit B, partial [Desulfococcaceae bacterium]